MDTTELRSVFPPFEALTEEARQKLTGQIRLFPFKGKQIICRAGFTPPGLFIVKKGKIKIYKINDSAKEIIIHIAAEKEMVGYSALVRHSDYHFWAEAIENSELIFIPKKIFYELHEGNPRFSNQLMLSFFTEFDNVIDKLVDILSDQVRKRTAKTLLWLVQTHGLEKDNKTISISLSRNDLAHLVATNTETLVRTLSEFKKEKIISLKGKKILIGDFDLLNRIVHLP